MNFGLKLTPLAAAMMLMLPSQIGYAGPGSGVNANGALAPTFYAHSPSGQRYLVDSVTLPLLQTGNVAGLVDLAKSDPTRIKDTGKALRKFVDPLPGLCAPGTKDPVAKDFTTGRLTNKCIPVAAPDTASYPGSDYYEIGVVEYKEWMHADLAKETTLRGYVQLNDPTNPVTKDPLTGKIIAWPNPHYLGPIIQATRGRPVRIKFVNLLPSGHAVVDSSTGALKVLSRAGDLFLPVDQTLMGAGLGPDGATMYQQNRAVLHLHGGDNPWISDGTPHQWILPAGDETSLKDKGMGDFARGAATQNVPDMPDPGPGAVTYYWPNNQSARLMFYHDHSAGITRLNVYAGEAAGYLISDDAEAALLNSGTVNGVTINKALPKDMIPLIIQEKTFVSKDVADQDAKWDTAAWGQEGDLWFPHVYEVNQDPTSVDGTNPLGRWDWGPYFWPVFPSLYALPSGEYGDVTTTPEAFMDTPVVNGLAYPFLEVDPKAYRFRILNATNDRFLNLNLFVADDQTCRPLDPTDPIEVQGNQPICNVEPKMVQFAPGATRPDGTPILFPTSGGLMGTGWGQPDGRTGGVPDPATMGPSILQLGTEGGILPQLIEIPPTPVNYEYARRSVTVLNILEHGLLMGAAERADVVIDFSKYAGKTLILYNDAPAPVPAFDPRIDFFYDKFNPNSFDNYLSGGASPTQPGYGPNTRTIMQIRVRNTAPAPAFDTALLAAELPKAYGVSQEKPIVPQSAYNSAFGANWTDQYAKINTGTLQQPTFDFTPADGATALGGIQLLTSGAGYARPPIVQITDSTNLSATGAMASATLKVGQIVITNPGRGYVNVPTVTIATTPPAGGVSNAPGSGAAGVAYLKVVGASGSGLSNLSTSATFSVDAPAGWAKNGSKDVPGVMVRAKLSPIIKGNKVTGVQIVDSGAGYTVLPRVTISDPKASLANVTLDAGVQRVDLTSPVPTDPTLAGGRGYTDMTLVNINFTGGGTNGTPANVATAVASGSVSEVTLASSGTGYGNPVVTLNKDPKDPGVAGVTYAPASAQATSAAKMAIHNKAIQELFEPNYGRMNATLGVEMPFTSALTQTTVPLAYIDPMTEQLKDGETQIWKITHNGVDTHPVHFHLANLQLVNRIGWDGTIKPPKPNELGWKETIQMNPLEDIVVAVRAKRPSTGTGANGFGLPTSYRLMDPTQPQYAMTGFTQIDAKSGSPAVVYNDYQDYNWEYVWHCHILGHEENDFMRPLAFDPMDAKPAAPTINGVSVTNLTVNQVQVPVQYKIGTTLSSLSWKDNAATEFKYEVYVQSRTRSSKGIWPAWGSLTLLGTALANANPGSDVTHPDFPIPQNLLPAASVASNKQWRFIVRAVGANGNGESSFILAPSVPTAP